MRPRVMLSGGGTGGSVTPLLAVAEVLRAKQTDILFVGSTDGPEQKLVDAANIPWQAIPAGKLRRYTSWQNIRDLGRIWAGYRQAGHVIAEWRPQVVVSAGSYVSVPLIWSAKRRGIPTLIHQQDILPGLANRLMSRAADVISINFAPSRQYFPQGKIHIIGNPVRPAMLTGEANRGRQRFGLDPSRPVLLIMGGGTGSAPINDLVATALPELVRTWEIIHLTGHHRGPTISSQPHYHPFTFLTDDLPDAMAAADVVVSRAGLGVLTELMSVGKPAIIIPMPDTHQEANANYLADQHAVVALDQRHLTADQLIATITTVYTDQSLRLRLTDHLSQLFKPNATADMAELILRLARR